MALRLWPLSQAVLKSLTTWSGKIMLYLAYFLRKDYLLQVTLGDGMQDWIDACSRIASSHNSLCFRYWEVLLRVHCSLHPDSLKGLWPVTGCDCCWLWFQIGNLEIKISVFHKLSGQPLHLSSWTSFLFSCRRKDEGRMMFEEYAFCHKRNRDLLYASLKYFMFKDDEVQDTPLYFWRSKL